VDDGGPHLQAKAGSPNVLLWVLDDTGYAQTSAYGTKSIRTPTLQRLADNGGAEQANVCHERAMLPLV
jgi:hypothetical protein